jgi:hypothetical protein
MNVIAQRALDKVREELKKVADFNGDGQLSRADIDMVVSKVKVYADAEVHKKPWGVVVACCLCSAVIGGLLTKLFC